MTDTITMPDDCQTMIEVRAGVDATDRALMDLLERRFGYMRAAARIKQDRTSVRDEGRKTEVVLNARNDARKRGLPAEPIGEIWDSLVEASIAYEFDHWDRFRSA